MSQFPPTVDELLEEFAELQDWDERYDFIVDLGRELPPFPAEQQTEQNVVSGCMSTVWLVVEPDGDDPSRLRVRADSDSIIVKGLIVILLACFDRKTPEEILKSDAQEVFAQFGLDQHLSPQRRNGLFSMVKRLKQLAAEAVAAS